MEMFLQKFFGTILVVVIALFIARAIARRKLRKETLPTDLSFKNSQSAFEYSCAYMNCDLRCGCFLPALIVDARQLGDEEAVKTHEDGIQTCALRVASNDGGFLVFAQTAGANGPKLEPGMLVGWQAGAYNSEIAKINPEDKRFGWVGLIAAVLHPNLDIKKGWKIDEPFTA